MHTLLRRVGVGLALLYALSIPTLALSDNDFNSLAPSPESSYLLIPTEHESVEKTSTQKKVVVERPPVVASDKIQASVSAYTSDVGETDSTPTITASGVHVGNTVAACPTRFKFGTRIQIGDRVYTCWDRMAARYQQGNYFDLFFASKSAAYAWGRKTVSVTIL